MNTLFLIPGEVGGSETVVRNLLPELQQTSSVELLLFTNRENHDTFSGFQRVPIHVRARSRVRRIVFEQTALVRAARKAGLDVLFSPGYTAPLIAPCPQVVHIHDMQYMVIPQDFSFVARTAHRFLVGNAARVATVITTVSEFAKRQICTFLGTPDEKVVVAPNGASDVFFQPHPCDRNKPFLLCVGNTYPHKNAARLVRAFSSIADRIPHDLVIVGQPGAGEPPPHPRVERLHRVPIEQLSGLYHGCDLFVFPSEYEGFGLPVVEALASGARVVAARAGAIPEVGGSTVTYFEPTAEEAIAKAVMEALEEPPEERRRYTEAGRARAKQFTWRRTAEQVLRAVELATSLGTKAT